MIFFTTIALNSHSYSKALRLSNNNFALNNFELIEGLLLSEKHIFFSPSLTPTFAYFLQSPYFPRFSYGLCVLQILFFLYGECFKFTLSYICFACFEGLLHWRISMVSPNGFFPFVVTSFWVLIRRTISVQ